MIKAYGYTQKRIDNLMKISNNENNFYNYKDLNFLSMLRIENENLVINFHGSIPGKLCGTYEVVFRGFSYKIDNTDIVCISDYLLSKYKNGYTVSWTLETKNHSYSDLLYSEIFEYIINMKNYKKIIFTGTSAGGFPSLKFGSYFNAIVLISNSQLYIENYINNRGIDMIRKYINVNDDVIYKNKMIEKIILNSQPKKIYYYQNIKDNNDMPHNSYADFLQFKNFITTNKLDNICIFRSFNNNIKTTNQHSILFPNNKKHIDILKEIIHNTL